MASLRFQRGLFLLPIVSFCFLVLSLIATYVVAAGLGHVEFNFPYISYTGLKVPERGIFGQLLNMGAILLALNVYARYLRLNDYQTDVSRLNTACLVLGMISSFGQTMVANFETKVMRGPHYVGAGLAFGIGGIYCWLQALISWRVRRESRMPYHRVFWSQLAVSIAITVFAVTFGVSKAVYKSYDNEEELKKIGGPVRSAYLTSTVTEWLLAISIMFYLLTYVPEFRQVTVTGPCICRDRRDEAVSESRDKLDADSHPMVTSNGKFTSAA